MRYYMFGMDPRDPEGCARELRCRGIDTVVGVGGRSAEAAAKAGLRVIACYGAFHYAQDDPREWLAEDAFGERRVWFGSGCPNSAEIAEHQMEAALRDARGSGAEEIWADGARFASPEPGTELFGSCFCPRCMRLGTENGFDMERMRSDVRAFLQDPGTEIPPEWLRFREMCIGRYFDRLAEKAHALGLKAGSFVFADSLSRLVGQSGQAVRGLDTLAPMLYRRYAQFPGIACLNGEYASLYRLFEQRGDASPVQCVKTLTGTDVPCEDADRIRANGFGCAQLARETAAARRGFSGQLMPIIQLDDAELAGSIAAAGEGGADGIGFFLWKREYMPYLDPVRLG